LLTKQFLLCVRFCFRLLNRNG